MLRFGGGYYDLPDRIFFSRTLLCANLTALSVNDTWHAVLSNASDEKELIPEFFDGPGDFLVNRLNLPLGIRQDGKEAPPLSCLSFFRSATCACLHGPLPRRNSSKSRVRRSSARLCLRASIFGLILSSASARLAALRAMLTTCSIL